MGLSMRTVAVAHGCRCLLCQRHLGVGYGAPRLCPQCDAAQRPAALEHDSFARCPACANLWKPEHGDRLENEEDVPLTCPKCDHEFEVRVEVSYQYTSPALQTTEVS